MDNAKPAPRYQQIFEQLERDILSGKYKAGQKLPSEAELVRRLATSRITIGRALRELGHVGLVERRAGSGTYVRAENAVGLLFGLLIVNLGETEIFEPICHGIARAPQASSHALLWGHSTRDSATRNDQASHLCRQYISRRVSGVFFAPVEHTPGCETTNMQVVAKLENAGIPVVLLDRPILAFPARGTHDLVGIDNRRAGYTITEHLLKLGRRKIAFVGYPNSASTISARIAGYREALYAWDQPVEAKLVSLMDPAGVSEVQRFIENTRPDAIVSGNDRTAGNLMQSLLGLGVRVPSDIAIVGIDDVEYARLLPVPLTTVQQPCWKIGEAAMAAMLERVGKPDMPGRDILLDFKLVIRQSCGAPPIASVDSQRAKVRNRAHSD